MTEKNLNINTVIFIVGNSRSGTTMVSQILGQNNQVFSFNEIHFFEQLVASELLCTNIGLGEAQELFSKLLEIQRKGYLHTGKHFQFINEAFYAIKNTHRMGLRHIDIYKMFLSYETLRHDKLVACKQTPRNVFFLNEILSLFPNAKIINMVRDPRAVLNSQKGKWKLKFLGLDKIPLAETFRSWINYHPLTVSKLWSGAIKSSLKFQNNKQVLTLKFEDLVNQPNEQINDLCEFIGIDYDEAMLSIPYWGSSREKNTVGKKGIQQTATNAWRNSSLSNEELYICQKNTKKEMKSLGYSLVDVKPSFLKLTYLYLLFPIHIGLAILFNLQRSKNIINSIKRRMQ